MKRITLSEFIENLDEYQARLQMETIVIVDEADEPQFAMIPNEVFRQLRKDRRAIHVSELSDEDIKAIANTKMSEKYAYLDEELDE